MSGGETIVTLYINNQERNDIRIQAGGSLEQTSEHATSSTLTVEISTRSEPIKECDYLQIYDNESLVFSGIVLQVAQQSFPTELSFAVYELTLAGNSDFVANVYVDLGFPAGATISQILYGNTPSIPQYYNSNLPEFRGIFPARIEPEGITIGTVDDFSSFELENTAYLWGKTVQSLLDDLASVAGAYWEITSDKTLNIQYAYNLSPAPFALDNTSQVYDVSVSKDALTTYSACRVIGGQGELVANSNQQVLASAPSGLPSNAQYIYYEDESTLISNLSLASIETIEVVNGSSKTVYNVGFEGINDDDTQYQALITYGGDTISLKDGYSFPGPPSSTITITCTDVVYLVNVFSRVIDPTLCQEIAEQRGGTGIVEYVLEDETIKTFSDAVIAGKNFLKSYGQRAIEITFYTFSPCAVGQMLSVDLPYYSVKGNYEITHVVSQFITATEGSGLIVLYEVTASNIQYRDPYKGLFYTPSKVTFALESNEAPENSYYYLNAMQIKSYISAFTSIPILWSTIEERIDSWSTFEETFPSWYQLQSGTSPYVWSQIQSAFPSWAAFERGVKSWAFLEGIQRAWYYSGNFLTNQGRNMFLQLLKGETPSYYSDLHGSINLISNGSTASYTPEQTNILSNGAVSTYYIGPTESVGTISSIDILADGENFNNWSVPASIPHTSEKALTISVQTVLEGGQYLTDTGKGMMLSLMSGQAPSLLANYYNDLYVSITGSALRTPEFVEAQSVVLTDQGGISSYYIAPNELIGIINTLQMRALGGTEPIWILEIPANIDHSEQEANNLYALIIAIEQQII